MDLSPKRFKDLELLIKTRNEFNDWIHQGKIRNQMFLQNVDDVSKPFLKDVISKENEILKKLDNKVEQPKAVEPKAEGPKVEEPKVEEPKVIDQDEIYSKLIPITVDFKNTRPLPYLIRPISIMVEKPGNRFSGISINNINFFLYHVGNQDVIHSESKVEIYYPLTKGLIILLEGRGLLKLAADNVTQDDLTNYVSILRFANVDLKAYDYLIDLAAGGMGIGEGKDGKGFDLSDDDEDYDMLNNPIQLYVDLKNLLAAKLAGHNNVYNSVVDILKKLLDMKEITQDKYNKILNNYF